MALPPSTRKRAKRDNPYICLSVVIKVSLTLVGRSIMLEEVNPEKGKSIFELGAEGREIFTEIFKGHEIRFGYRGTKQVAPIADIYNATGIKADTFQKLVKRVELTFPGCIQQDVASAWGETDPFHASKKIILIDNEGITHVFQMMQVERIRDPNVRENIRDFQAWMASVVSGALSGTTEVATLEVMNDNFRQGDIRVQPFGEYFKQQMMVVEALKNVLHIDLNTSTCLALQKTEDKFKEDMSGYRALIPKVKLEDVPYLTPSDIATQLGYPSPQAVNKRLQIMGLQELVKEKVSKTGKETRFWRPTEGGKPHALFEAYARNGHSGYQLRWKESILSLMKQYDIKHAFW